LGQEEVTGRIMDLLKNFDKVCLGKVDSWGRRKLTICIGERCFEGIPNELIKEVDAMADGIVDLRAITLHKRLGFGQSGYCRGCDGYRGGMSPGQRHVKLKY
jgi:hypothetical protein